jgi:hypothetical protein
MSHSQIGNIVLPRQPPRPNMHKFETFSLVRDTLPAHNASLASLNTGASTLRPQGNMPNMPIITVPTSKSAESYRPALFTNHGITENLGGSPRWESQRLANRPTNPRSLTMPKKVTYNAEPTQIRLTEPVVVPKANLPNLPKFNAEMMGNPNPMTFEARAVLPTLRIKDLGGIASSTSKYATLGQSHGRAFGAESWLKPRMR